MIRQRAAEVFPPGEFIRDEIEARGWSQADLAEILGRPVQAINEMIAAKKAITPETAQRLGEAFGTGAQFWLNVENTYRLSIVSSEDSGVSRRARLFEKGPIREMIRRNWVKDSNDLDTLEKSVAGFFELRSIDETPTFAFGAKKQSYDSTSASQIAWCYRAKQLAESLKVAGFSPDGIVDTIKRFRTLAGSVEGVQQVPAVLAELGVRFVIVEPLKSTKIDGAAFWLDDNSPVIALSMRYDRIDNFWFVLGHELAHIKNCDQSVDVELVGTGAQPMDEKPEFERKADKMAATLLVPAGAMKEFVSRHRPKYPRLVILGFAKKLGVHPGIIVGQLQYKNEISYSHSREMLRPVRDHIIEVALTDGWSVK